MKTFHGVVMLVSAFAVGCGGDEDTGSCEEDGGAACFELPTAVMVAHAEAGGTSAPNVSCPKPAPHSSTQAVMISGTLKHYTSGALIGGATMELFGTAAFTSPIGTLTTATDGTFLYTVPQGTPTMLHLKVTGSGLIDAYGMYQRFDDTMATITGLDYRGANMALLDTIETATRVDQLDGKDAIAAVVSDCDGKQIEHAVVTLSSTSGKTTHLEGYNVFYALAGAFPLPVKREDRIDSNSNGAVALMNVPVGATVYAQAWGWVDDAAKAKGKEGLTLIAEWETPTHGDAAIALPLRAYTP